MVRKLALIGLLFATSCTSAELMPPQLTTHEGAAARRPIHRVVALPMTCGGLVSMADEAAGKDKSTDPMYIAGKCPKQALKGADQAIRASLDFHGYTVIDSETVNAVTATRHEVVVSNEYDTLKTVEQVGSLFEDATPNEQKEILEELNADALLNARVFVGSSMGVSHRRTLIVQVRLRAVSDGALVWARRCELEIGGLVTDTIAIEQGARCVSEGAR
jgi:hypothetical protein